MLLGVVLVTAQALAAWEPADAQGDRFNKTVDALNGGRPDKAEKLARELLEADPSCGRCQTLLVRSVLRQDRIAEAETLAADLLGSWSEQPGALSLAAEVAFVAQRFHDARDLAAQGQALAPGDPELAALRQRIELRLGDYDLAAQLLDAAEAQGQLGTDVLACLRGDLAVEQDEFQAASALADACAHHEPRWAAAIRTNAAALQGEVARLDDASAVGNDELAQRIAAHKACADGDYAGCERIVSRLLKRDPRDAEMWALRGAARYFQGRLSEALDDFGEALDHPEYIKAHEDGLYTGVLTKLAADAYAASMSRAALLRVLLLASNGDTVQARRRAQEAADTLEIPWLGDLGDAVTVFFKQGPAAGWQQLLPLLQAHPDHDAVQILLADLINLDPEAVPPQARAAMAGGKALFDAACKGAKGVLKAHCKEAGAG